MMPSSASARIRRFTSAVALAMLATVAAPITGAEAVPIGSFPELAPPTQRVVMFTDSVGLGAKSALPRAFPADWDVHVDGQPARFVEQLENNFVKPQLAYNPSWFGDHVVIAAGYNYPYWDPDRFERSVDSMINTLTAAGVKHVYWVTLREIDPQYISASAWRQVQPYYWYFPTVNEHLEAALERHPNLTLIDWAAAANRPGVTYDAIHLNNEGAALYSDLIRSGVEAASHRVDNGATTRIRVADAGGAAAAAVNLTTTDPRAAGFLTLHRCDGPVPVVSMHNYGRAETVAHSGIVALDDNGDFCVTTRSATNLIVDVTGLFPAGKGFEVVTPTRWFDSRQSTGRIPIPAGGTVELDIDDIRSAAGLVGDPSAVAVVATATEAASGGWLRVITCGSAARTSNVNYVSDASSPNLVIVAPDADGRICLTTLSATHVIVDLFGVFAGDADIDATTATRAFDSRDADQPVAAGSVTVIDIADVDIDPTAGGVVVNLTATDASSAGYATAYPCADGRPTASNLNVSVGQVAANAALIAPDANGEICVFALSSMHLIVDVMGAVGEAFEGRQPTRALDTRN